MRLIIQRVLSASVTIDEAIYSQINHGLLILLGVTHDDTKEDIEWLVQKIINLRIFNDEEGKMNRSIQDVQGEFLVVSQFTLYASTKKGNRPSFIVSAKPEIAVSLYENFIEEIIKCGLVTQTGVFGADMKVALVNDGPVTIIIDSKNKE